MMLRLGNATRPAEKMRLLRALSALAPTAIALLLATGFAPWSEAIFAAGSDEPPQTSSVSSWFGKGNNSNASLTAPAKRDSFGNPEQPGMMEKISNSFSNAGKKIRSVFHPASQKSARDQITSPNDPVSLKSKPVNPSADFYVSVARMEERANNLKSATAQCQRALEIDPKHLGALLALARLYDRQGQLKDATKYYREATKYHAREPSPFNDLGLCLARQQKYHESAENLRKAVELQPDKVLYRNNLATVLVELGRTEEAYETLSAVHGKTIAHYNIGFLLNKRGKKQDALEQFRLAAASDQNFEAAQQWVAKLSAEMGGAPAAPATTVGRSSAPAVNTSGGPSLGGAPLLRSTPAEPAGNAAVIRDSNEDAEGPALPGSAEQLPAGTPIRVDPLGSGDGPRFQETRRPDDGDSAMKRLPPTPDSISDYWARRNVGGGLQPLPPIDDNPQSYPPSRY